MDSGYVVPTREEHGEINSNQNEKISTTCVEISEKRAGYAVK